MNPKRTYPIDSIPDRSLPEYYPTMQVTEDCTSSVAGSSIGTGILASSVNCVASTSADLGTVVSPIESTVNVTCTVTGAVLGEGILDSSVTGTCIVTGSNVADGVLASSVSGVAAVFGEVVGSTALETSIAGTSSPSGEISSIGILDTSTTGTSSVSGVNVADGILVATATGTTSITADINTVIVKVYAESTVNCTCTVSGEITGDGVLYSSIQGTCSVVGSSPVGAGVLNAAIACIATSTASLSPAPIEISSTINVLGTTLADIQGWGESASLGQGNASVVASSFGVGVLRSTCSGVASSTVTLTARIPIEGAISGVASTSTDIVGLGILEGLVEGIASTSAPCGATIPVEGTSNGSATCTGSAKDKDKVVYPEVAGYGKPMLPEFGEVPPPSAIIVRIRGRVTGSTVISAEANTNSDVIVLMYGKLEGSCVVSGTGKAQRDYTKALLEDDLWLLVA